jgi:predicted nucleotidyltransferase
MKAREGDLIETDDSIILDVKGLVHPRNLTIAFIRYFPDKEGERRRSKTTYRKVYSLSERYATLEKSFPQYLVYDPVFDETMCEVPDSDVKRHFKPAKRLREMRSSKYLDLLESKALRLAELLKERANVVWSAIGVSGSILVQLHGAHSDIDTLAYGSENCRKVHFALQDFLGERNGPFKCYDRRDLKSLFDFRSKDTMVDFESFVRTESRKVIQGKFLGTDYFVRFVKSWNEIDERYGDIQYKNVGVVEIKATVADDSEAIFTPCTYEVKGTQILDGPRVGKIEQIVSFRGRFCEQAKVGETIIARGKTERVIDNKHGREFFRLLLGNQPSDFMILA